MSAGFRLDQPTAREMRRLRESTGMSMDGARKKLRLDAIDRGLREAKDIDDMRVCVSEIVQMMRGPL